MPRSVVFAVRNRVIGALFCLFWGASMGAGLGLADPPATAAPKPVDPKAQATIAHIRLSGDLAEGPGQGGIWADVSPRLHRLVERLDKAATDERVAGVLLVIESPELWRGRVD